MVTICLNMIVKNESKIIERLLKSVVNFIDCYCICDTGSEDNTIELINNFFSNTNIKGKIIQEKFRNFGYNRNFALDACLGMSDYLLLIDADMIFITNDKFNKSVFRNLVEEKNPDVFSLFQGSESFFYDNKRIIRNSPKYRYIEPTHEVIPNHRDDVVIKIKKDDFMIIDVGDGGCKADKFERDIRIYLEDLITYPDKSRTYFYLANSYYCLNKYESAILNYRKRITYKYDDRERWYSYYRIGLCYKALGQDENAIYEWLQAFEILPNRIENLYEIINHFRFKEKYKLAYQYCKIALNIIMSEDYNSQKEEFLFVHEDVYAYKLFFEYSIIAYYNGTKQLNGVVVTILNNCPKNNYVVGQTLSNYKYYRETLLQFNRITIDLSSNLMKEHFNTETKFNSSSLCLIPNKNSGFDVNIRYVNYSINPNGTYKMQGPKIITINEYCNFDGVQKSNTKLFDLKYENLNKNIQGIEDVRIFRDINENLKFIGTYMNDTTEKITVVVGNYDLNKEFLNIRNIETNFPCNKCEKNWVYVNCYNDTKIIYNWSPLMLCTLTADYKMNIFMEQKMPRIFNYIRGSTCGFNYKDEIWFVCHVVSNENPRYYYHIIVIFDKSMFLLRYSALFSFEGNKIEYCLGLIVNDDDIIMSYSTNDETSKIAYYDKNKFESHFMIC